MPASPKSSSGFPRWLVILVAILVWPITVSILIWRTKWSLRTKWVLTGLLVAVVGVAAITQPHLTGPQTASVPSPLQPYLTPSPSPVAKPSPTPVAYVYLDVEFPGPGCRPWWPDCSFEVGMPAAQVDAVIKALGATMITNGDQPPDWTSGPTVVNFGSESPASWWKVLCKEVLTTSPPTGDGSPSIVLYNTTKDASKKAAQTFCDANATS